MTDAVIIALIVAVPPTIAGSAALIVAVRNGKKTSDLQISVDGRLTELLAANKLAANAQGRQDERDSHVVT